MLEPRKLFTIINLFTIIDSVYPQVGSDGLHGDTIEAQCLEVLGNENRRLPIAFERATPSTSDNVQLTRHHIIPVNILTDFFNSAVRRNDEHNVELSGIMNFIGFLANDSLNLYPGPGIYQRVRNDLAQLRTLQSLYISDINLNNPPLDILFDAKYLVHSLFQWIPANIFIGPSARTDDPGEGFEENAIYIIGRRNFERLNTIRRLMLSYISTGQRNEFNQVIELLCEISKKRNTPYPYNPDQWVRYSSWFGDTKYYIDRNSKIRRKRNMTVSHINEDPYCVKPIETLKMMIENNNLMIIAKALERVKNSKNSYKFYKEDKSSWKEYYASMTWDKIYAKGVSMCGDGWFYNAWGYKFNDDSFAVGIVATDAKNGKDNWVNLSLDFTRSKEFSEYAGQVYFDKNGRPVAIVISASVTGSQGSGWSFIYNGGEWEYESKNTWLQRFGGRTESLDANAPRFMKE